MCSLDNVHGLCHNCYRLWLFDIAFSAHRVAFESALVRVHGSLSRSKRKIEEESSQTTTNTAHCLISPETIRRIVISNIWFIVSLGLALFVPQVKYVMSPVGCMDGAFIFVFPGKSVMLYVC